MTQNHLKLSSIETRLIHSDRHLNESSAVAPPIFQTATFRADSVRDFAQRSSEPRHPEYYTRFGNPTLHQTETVLAQLEGAESALVTASGMGAATAAVLTFLSQGSHVIAQSNHYGGTVNLLQKLLPRFGVEVTQVDQRNAAAFEGALRPNTKMILTESPSNPIMVLTDLSAIAALGKSRGITTIVDNTFATPINQRPLDLGCDLVFHSATKYLGGHSDLLAGVVMGSNVLIKEIWDTHVILGAVLGPFDSWLMLRGLRTLSLRVRQHNVLAAPVPSFSLQHLVENAVRHGIAKHPDGGSVRVVARREDDTLVLSVIDDGVGISPETLFPKDHGIDNTQERLRTLYGERASLVVARGPSGGTVATLRIPYREIVTEPDVAES